ncbi:hypothetical protein LTR60_002081 [Cryomyces antarcticus]|nr:hypothetical protein LTR39_002138 [Cryomyces antarcticus]KAK5017122.1 hypothetical protein LTR60_002081 [Cryomyces antarcticus]
MHQVKPVTAGYRFVLTYNLVRTGPGVGYSLAALDDPSLKLKDVLRSWHQSAVHTDHAPRKLIYILEHKYSDASLEYDQLKGKDQLRAKTLKNVGAEMGFDVFLASLEREVIGGAEEDSPYGGYGDFHKIVEEAEEMLKLDRVVSFDGSEIQRDVDIDESDIVQVNPFDRDPDEEDYEGWTGNEGCNATHWYRDTVLVVAPHQYKIDLALDAIKHDRSKVVILIDNVTSKFVSEPSRTEGELFRLCEAIVETNEARRKEHNRPSGSAYGYHYKTYFSDDAVGKVMNSVVLLDRAKMGSLFERAASCVKEMVPLEVYGGLREALRQHGFVALREGLTVAISHTPTVHGRLAALDALAPDFSLQLSKSSASNGTVRPTASIPIEPVLKVTNASGPQIGGNIHASVDGMIPSDWIAARVDETLRLDYELTKKDGVALADFVGKHADNTWLFQEILPYVKKHTERTPFVMAFLIHLYEQVESEKLTRDVTTNVFRDVLFSMAADFTLEEKAESNKRQQTTYYSSSPAFYEPPNHPIEGSDLGTLLGQCISLGLTNEVEMLLDNTASQLNNISESSVNYITFPLLKQLLHVWKEGGVDLANPAYETFFQRVIATKIMRCVKMEPVMPADWSQRPQGCGCEDRRKLDRFLTSPTAKFERFAIKESRRKHLERQLNSCSNFSRTTDRGRSPYSLVITKSRGGWRGEHQAWETRFRNTARTLRSLGDDEMKQLLAGRWEEFMELRAVKSSTTPAVSGITPLAPKRNTQRVGPAPKFKRDVVDLTDD